MSNVELEAFHAVQLHSYCTKLDIEAKTLEEIVVTQVLPAVMRYQTELAQNINAMRSIDMVQNTRLQVDLVKRININVEAIQSGLKRMHEAHHRAHLADEIRIEAGIFCHEVKPEMDNIRTAVDDLESIVDDQYWPLVKYRELLFV